MTPRTYEDIVCRERRLAFHLRTAVVKWIGRKRSQLQATKRAGAQEWLTARKSACDRRGVASASAEWEKSPATAHLQRRRGDLLSWKKNARGAKEKGRHAGVSSEDRGNSEHTRKKVPGLQDVEKIESLSSKKQSDRTSGKEGGSLG